MACEMIKMMQNNLRCLVFSYRQEHFGIDVEQIDALSAMDQASDVELSYFHELFSGQPASVVYRHPLLLLMKTAKQTRGIVIEQPDNIVDVSLENIRPLPPLIAACRNNHPLWGVAVRENEWFFLVDLRRLAGCRPVGAI